MKTKQNDIFLRVLRGEKVPRTPVWMMRQAGRYLPEYRQVRSQAGGFMDLCKNTDLACEVTMQPLRRFKLDAAILFSDILTIPDAMGLGLYFVSGEGPKFKQTVRSSKDVDNLIQPSMNEALAYVMDAVSAIRKELNGLVPLIGFSGSPWTLASYMVEGQSSRDFTKTKTLLYQEPVVMHRLLEKLTQGVSDYLKAQIMAGAQAVMIFDTWGGVLPHWAYNEFSLNYMAQIVATLKQDVNSKDIPILVFSKGGGQWLAQIKTCAADGVGLDWTTSLAQARCILGEEIALQGNLDPGILRTSPEVIKREVARVLADYGYGHRHIFNLGHGITPDISPENVQAMIDTVHALSPVYHQGGG